MIDLQIKTYAGGDIRVNGETIDSLKESIRGRVLTPRSEQYDEARTIWNAMINRRPALIVQCASAADVVRVVRFAGKNKLLVQRQGVVFDPVGNQ